jgi:mono/diheme cytochrome c family protein
VRTLKIVLLGVMVCIVGAVAVLHGRAALQLGRRYDVAAAPVAVLSDSAGVARGEHLYRSVTCALCHGDDGGGAIYSDAGPIGFLAGPNLTSGRGGVAPLRSDLDWVRAIRHGVRSDSTSLLVMPSEVFVHLTDADLGAILGYLRQLPPVDREIPASRFRWLGRLMLGAGRMNILVAPKTPSLASRSDAVEGATPAYGRYLADISGCHGCHGHGLSGGAVAGPPGLPPASNLTPAGLAGWSDSAFVTAMRTGKRSDGTTLDEFMPWRAFQHMHDVELAALWAYLQSVPPKPFGGK